VIAGLACLELYKITLASKEPQSPTIDRFRCSYVDLEEADFIFYEPSKHTGEWDQQTLRFQGPLTIGELTAQIKVCYWDIQSDCIFPSSQFQEMLGGKDDVFSISYEMGMLYMATNKEVLNNR